MDKPRWTREDLQDASVFNLALEAIVIIGDPDDRDETREDIRRLLIATRDRKGVVIFDGYENTMILFPDAVAISRPLYYQHRMNEITVECTTQSGSARMRWYVQSSVEFLLAPEDAVIERYAPKGAVNG